MNLKDLTEYAGDEVAQDAFDDLAAELAEVRRARDTLRARLEALTLRYSTQTPTRPGFYWLKKREDHEPEIVAVQFDDGELRYFYAGVDQRYTLDHLSYFPNALWAGPIPEPSTQEEP